MFKKNIKHQQLALISAISELPEKQRKRLENSWVGTFYGQTIPETTCVLCGQCVGVCPTGALKPKREYLLEQGLTPDQISVLGTGRKKRKA